MTDEKAPETKAPKKAKADPLSPTGDDGVTRFGQKVKES